MIQDKELLLKDLCARLPYDVKVRRYVYTTPVDSIQSVELFDPTWLEELYAEEAEFKPYLFPLSSITEEQYKEIWDCMSADNKETLERANSGQKCANPYSNVADYYNAHHLDYRGLIPKGLAIDATGLNIY